MTLIRGARLASYEIVDLLGAGGMGEVYRARDPKLGRDVAVKVLPDLFAGDPEHRARFEREARMLAALSHPNILAIHDFGVADGTAYAVTELLQGQTLRDRLQSGPVAPRRAIEIGAAIASGLAAAHEKGIVHRDLKPENVFITTDGRIKLLDFGLARLADGFNAVGPDAGTVVQTATAKGTVLGTVGYMSPEQVRGLDADHRSDLFSFGVVLYEVISGRRAFAAASAVETMNAILNDEPPELGAAAPSVPPGLQRVIERCLEKHPERRFQSASDLAFAIQQAAPTSASNVESGRVARKSTRFPTVGQAAVVVALAAAFAAGRWLSPSAAPEASLSFQRLTFRPGNILHARFSPDGRTVLYSASWQGAASEVFTVRTDSRDSRSLDLHNADVVGMSASGELAIVKSPFHTAAMGILATMPPGAGAPRDVLQDVFIADWGPKPEDLAAVRRSANGFRRLEYPIGHVLYESPSIGSMRVSPDGQRIALVSNGEVIVMSSATGAIALRHGWGATGRAGGVAWSPSGSEVFATGGPTESEQALRAISLSGREGVVIAGSGGRFDLHDVSASGEFLIERAEPRGGILFRGAADPQERDLSWLDGSDIRRMSRDGSWILFSETLQGGNPRGDVFLRRTDGSPPIRLGDGQPLDLSSDGKWVLTLTRQKPARLVLLPTGAGSPRLLDTGSLEPNGGAILADGSVGFGTITREGRVEFHRLDPQTGAVAPLSVAGGGEASTFVVDRGAVIGPGGAFARILSDRHIEILRKGGVRATVPGPPLDADDDLVDWLSDGTLFIARRATLPMQVDRIDSRTGDRRPWRTLMPADPTGVISIRNIVIADDGQTYAYAYRRVTSSDLYLVRPSSNAK